MVCKGVTHVSYRPLHILLSLLQGLHRSTPRRMVCKGHYLLVLFGGWSPELPYLSFSVRGLQYLFRALLLVLPSRQARHMVCTYISPTSFCPFRRMFCTYSPTCPLSPVGTRFGHTPAAARCRRRHLAALPASGPGASASAGGAPALLGASASAGGAPALRGASAARGSLRSSRAERKEDGAIRLMICTCPFRRMVCYTCLLFAVTRVLFGGWSTRFLFGGWSVTHVSYLPLHMSFSADGLHVSFSADGLLHLSLLGLPDPAQTGTHRAWRARA